MKKDQTNKTGIYADLGDGNPENGWEYYIDEYAIEAENPSEDWKEGYGLALMCLFGFNEEITDKD